MRAITDMRCARLISRFDSRDGRSLEVTEAAREEIVARAQTADIGARVIDNILTGTVVPQLAALMLDAMADDGPIQAVTVDADESGRLICQPRNVSADGEGL